MNVSYALLNGVLLLAALPVVLMALYLLLLAVAAFGHPGRRQITGRFAGPREATTRFLILIPAHNEELLLGGVVDQLRRQSYPADRYRIVVIADNCEDSTANVARTHGATVLERTDTTHRGKGQALNWAMRERLAGLGEPYDAVVILDADSTVNADFLWFMDEQLVLGREALQGYYGVQNPLENWRTSLLTASLAAFHFLRPLGRDRFGLPCGLKGNGMCFSRRLIEAYAYPAFSVVEDVELALFYLRQGIGVKFVPGAQVFGQMAVSGRAAGTQRVRWEGGRMALIRTQAWPLLKEGLRLGDGSRLDGAMDLLVPPFTLLMACTAIPALIIATLRGLFPGAVWDVVAGLWVGALAVELGYVLASLVLIRAPLVVYRRLLFAPLFMLWKLGLYLKMALSSRKRGAQEWVRTDRHAMDKPDPDK
jgi:1,2-diacylglycerol 3-beta-glucosyltransferase